MLSLSFVSENLLRPSTFAGRGGNVTLQGVAVLHTRKTYTFSPLHVRVRVRSDLMRPRSGGISGHKMYSYPLALARPARPPGHGLLDGE